MRIRPFGRAVLGWVQGPPPRPASCFLVLPSIPACSGSYGCTFPVRQSSRQSGSKMKGFCYRLVTNLIRAFGGSNEISKFGRRLSTRLGATQHSPTRFLMALNSYNPCQKYLKEHARGGGGII